MSFVKLLWDFFSAQLSFIIAFVLIIGLSIYGLRPFVKHNQRSAILGSLVFSSFVAVLAALALTSGRSVPADFLFWLLFVGFAGVTIWLPAPIHFGDAVRAAIIPSVTFLICLILLFWIPILTDNKNWVAGGVSMPGSPDPDKWTLVLSLTLFIVGITIPAIGSATYAREYLIGMATKVTSKNVVSRLKNMEDIIKSVWRILLAIGVVLGITVFKLSQ